MIKTSLVWYLIVQGGHCAGLVNQLGPYADQQSCHNVMEIVLPIFDKKCVQVVPTENSKPTKGKQK